MTIPDWYILKIIIMSYEIMKSKLLQEFQQYC